MWVKTTVGGDDAVAVEVVVAGGIASVVASVGEDLSASDRTLVAQSLVNVLPYI